MSTFANLKTSPRTVQAKLRAALYNAQKRRKEREAAQQTGS